MRALQRVMLLALALAAMPAAAGNVAFVADIRGNATIEGDGKVTFLAELAAGTRLFLGTGASVCVTYAASGAEFTASGPGEFLVGATSLEAEKGAPPARRTVGAVPDAAVVARVAQAATASLRMRGAGRAPPAGGTLEYPVDTRIATLRPAVRWRAGGGEPVTLVLHDADGRELWRGIATKPGAPLEVMLSPGTRYSWTITTSRGTPAEARFETLGADDLARAARSAQAADRFSARVAHAMLLHELGAAQDAREAWAALARERPDLPELAGLAR